MFAIVKYFINKRKVKILYSISNFIDASCNGLHTYQL